MLTIKQPSLSIIKSRARLKHYSSTRLVMKSHNSTSAQKQYNKYILKTDTELYAIEGNVALHLYA